MIIKGQIRGIKMPYHNDPEATQWLHDYWDYIQMIEHHPATFDEVGGWDGLAQAFTDSQIHQQVLDYLAYDDYNGLTDRLNMLYSKYGNVKKMKKSNVRDQMPNLFTVDVGFEIPFRDHYDEGVWVNGHNSDEEGNAIGIWLDGTDVWIGLQFFEDYGEVSYSIYPIGSSTPIKEGSHKIDSVDGIIDGLEQFLINAGISEGEYELEMGKSTKKSQDIHSMIAQIRKNNNSLKKEPTDLYGNWSESHFVADVVGGSITMMQSNYFSDDAVSSYEGVIHGYATSTGVNDLHAWMTYNQVSGEISGRAVWGQYEKNYVPNGYVKDKKSLNAFIGEFKEFIKDFSEMIR